MPKRREPPPLPESAILPVSPVIETSGEPPIAPKKRKKISSVVRYGCLFPLVSLGVAIVAIVVVMLSPTDEGKKERQAAMPVERQAGSAPSRTFSPVPTEARSRQNEDNGVERVLQTMRNAGNLTPEAEHNVREMDRAWKEIDAHNRKYGH